jgi:hypothetical protein
LRTWKGKAFHATDRITTSARLFLQPQLVGERIYFLSNLSGHISLYSMDHGGSVPEPLLPQTSLYRTSPDRRQIVLRFPELGKILVMVDQDGDENYQPMLIPIQGGFPEPAFQNIFKEYRVHLSECDPDKTCSTCWRNLAKSW